MLSKIWATIKHNRFIISSIIVSVIIIGYAYGCQAEVQSPFDTWKMVTRPQLEIEVQKYAATISLAYADLQKQEEVKNLIVNAGLAYAQGEGINPVGLIATVMGILGIGAVVDNRQKDVIIVAKTNALNGLLNNNKGESS